MDLPSLGKSQAILELREQRRESAVEIIAIKIAQINIVDTVGFVIVLTAEIKTLEPGSISMPNFAAIVPKKIGTNEVARSKRAEIIAAIETVFGFLAAKHLCPISCSININKRGIKSQVNQGVVELASNMCSGGFREADFITEPLHKAVMITMEKEVRINRVCKISVLTTAFNPPIVV